MSSNSSESSILHWATLLFCAATFYVGWPLWSALVLAAWTAGLARPLLLRFERGLKGRRRAAAVLSLLLFLLLLTPLCLILLGVGSGAQDLVVVVSRATSAKRALADLAVGGVPPQKLHLPGSATEILELLQRYGSQAYSVTTRIAGAAASGLVALFIYFAGAFTFLVSGDEAWQWMRQNSPIKPERLDRLAKAFHETGRGLLVGVGLTSATQALAATVAYLALGVPRALVLGPITGLASVIPFVGTALVWGPIAVGLFFAGSPIKAVILVVVGVLIIGTIDNVLRPVYARLGTLQMPMFLLFVSVFGGLSAFGTWGAILGPLIVRLTLEALSMRKEIEATEPLNAGT